MQSNVSEVFERLLTLARGEDREALGRLLEDYRNYLTLLAKLQIDRRVQGKVDAADLVQETFVEAHRRFDAFRGHSEGELMSWLRKILLSKFMMLLRRFYGTGRRDLRLEQQLDAELEQSSQMVRALAQSHSSPSQKAARREEALLLADAVSRLEADYREVIILHDLEQLSLTEVAQRMGRSINSAQRLWIRALAALRRLLGGDV